MYGLYRRYYHIFQKHLSAFFLDVQFISYQARISGLPLNVFLDGKGTVEGFHCSGVGRFSSFLSSL